MARTRCPHPSTSADKEKFQDLIDEFGSRYKATLAWQRAGSDKFPSLDEAHRLLYPKGSLGEKIRAVDAAYRNKDFRAVVGDALDNKFNVMSRATGKKGLINGYLSPAEAAYQDFLYRGTAKQAYHMEIINKVDVPLENLGISMEDYGNYVAWNRIVTELKQKGVQSGGKSYEGASKGIADLEKKLGEEKFTEMEVIRYDMNDVRQEYVVEVIASSGLVSQQALDSYRRNPNYARFRTLEQEMFKAMTEGDRNHVVKMHKIVGGMGEIKNAYFETVNQDLMMIDAAARNKAKLRGVDALKDMSREANVSEFISKKLKPQEYTEGVKIGEIVTDAEGRPVYAKPPKGFSTIEVRRNGQIESYHVQEDIAALYNYAPEIADPVIRLISASGKQASNYFRQVLTGRNPIFQAKNLVRDSLGTGVRIGAGYYKSLFTKEGIKSFKQGFDYARGKPDAFVKEMLKNRELVTMDDDFRQSGEAREQVVVSKDQNFLGKLFSGTWEALGISGKTLDTAVKISGKKFLLKNPNLTKDQVTMMVRNEIGMPDVLTGGTATPITNSILMFSNVIKEGWKADVGAFKRDKAGYVARSLIVNVAPKLLSAAFAGGYLGKGYKEVMDAIDDKTKRDYHIIPLFLDDKGNPHYLQLPTTEASRPMLMALHAVLFPKGAGSASKQVKDAAFSLLHNVMTQAPSVSPFFSSAKTISDVVTTGNTYDLYRGGMAIPDRIQKLGGPKYHAAVADVLWNAAGLGAFISKPGETVAVLTGAMRDERSTVDRITQSVPGGKMLTAFYSNKGRGTQEMISDEVEETKKKTLQNRDQRSDLIANAVDAGKDPSVIVDEVGEKGLIGGLTRKTIERQISLYTGRHGEGKDAVWLKNLAGSNEERDVVISKYEQKHTKEQTEAFINKARQYGFISAKTARRSMEKIDEDSPDEVE